MEENSQKNVVNHFEAGSNCQVFNGNITGCTFAMPGSTVTQQCAPAAVNHTETSEKAEVLADAVAAVQQYMWGASAYAVLFCEYRDHRNYPNNMAQFERDIDTIARQRHLAYGCNAGTLSDAFRHNPYLEKHIDNWSSIGVKTRTMHLLRKFQEALP